MTSFLNRSIEEQDIIRKAYDFEIEAIHSNNPAANPYFDTLKALGLWEALNEAVEMAFN